MTKCQQLDSSELCTEYQERISSDAVSYTCTFSKTQCCCELGKKTNGLQALYIVLIVLGILIAIGAITGTVIYYVRRCNKADAEAKNRAAAITMCQPAVMGQSSAAGMQMMCANGQMQQIQMYPQPQQYQQDAYAAAQARAQNVYGQGCKRRHTFGTDIFL